MSGGRAEAAGHGSASRHSMAVTVTVEDVNEAPVFDEHNKHGKVSENRKEGAHVARFTATDPDTRGSNKIVYVQKKPHERPPCGAEPVLNRLCMF